MSSSIYRELIDRMEQGSCSVIETSIVGSQGSVTEDMKRMITDSLILSEDPVTVEKDEEQLTIKEAIFPEERMIILGGGHIALPLCEFAAKVGFSVLVCDDRPQFANKSRFPLAVDVICDSFQNAIQSLKISRNDYVIVITRGHRYDADCLRVLLKGIQPAYLGMIGSRRRVRGLFDLLSEEGYSRKALENIHSPIGLSIGAVTPEEITISILAEVIAQKRMPGPDNKNKYSRKSDIDLEVIQYLANSYEPQAVVTVIETKGSTPRLAGAKMVVNSIGQIVGSIGGGCSENEVVREAIQLIGTGMYKTYEIDLSGDVAEMEGMACGGIMRVLIEDDICQVDEI